jgi:hypothetical protein
MDPHCQPIKGTMLCHTPAEAVARFLHEGCADDAGRTMAIATLTLSLWQVTHGPITATVPSVLLVHANDDAGGDPIDAFAGEFVFHDVGRLEEWLNGDAMHPTLIGQDLFRSTLRAVVIGVASLSYHGWGFEAGVPRASVVRLLEHLRTKGPQSRRELQRKFPLWLKAGKRDTLLDRLAQEGLVICPDKQVSAVPLSDYVRWLHRQPEFPVEGCLSSLLLGRKCRQEGPLPGPMGKRKRRRKPRWNARGQGRRQRPERRMRQTRRCSCQTVKAGHGGGNLREIKGFVSSLRPSCQKSGRASCWAVHESADNADCAAWSSEWVFGDRGCQQAV